MEKLLSLIEKLKNEIVPEQKISKMSKADLLSFYDSKEILARARVFHQKVKKGIRSALTDDEDDFIPSERSLQTWKVGQLRRFLKQFHKATQIMKGYSKFTAARLRRNGTNTRRCCFTETPTGDRLGPALCTG